MPLAKAVVSRSSRPGARGLVGSDQLNDLVVDALRQLAQLSVICDVMVAELVCVAQDVAERVTSLTARTSRLAETLDALDALTVNVRTYIHSASFLCTPHTQKCYARTPVLNVLVSSQPCLRKLSPTSTTAAPPTTPALTTLLA